MVPEREPGDDFKELVVGMKVLKRIQVRGIVFDLLDKNK